MCFEKSGKSTRELAIENTVNPQLKLLPAIATNNPTWKQNKLYQLHSPLPFPVTRPATNPTPRGPLESPDRAPRFKGEKPEKPKQNLTDLARLVRLEVYLRHRPDQWRPRVGEVWVENEDVKSRQKALSRIEAGSY